MAKALGWSKSTVYKSLAVLQEKHLLQAISSKQGTIITVCYWEELTSCQSVPQNVLDALGAKEVDAPADPILEILRQNGLEPSDHENVQDDLDTQEQRASATAQRVACRHVNHMTAAEVANEERLLGGFELFWNAYPRKIDRAAAYDMYRSLDADPAQLMDALEAAKRSRDWQKENRKYIPSPAKWLDGGWEQYASVCRNAEEIWTSR